MGNKSNKANKSGQKNTLSSNQSQKDITNSSDSSASETMVDEKPVRKENSSTGEKVEKSSSQNGSVGKREFSWPSSGIFKDLNDGKSKFQIEKISLDKTNKIDVNNLMLNISEASKEDAKIISKEKKLDDKRLHQVMSGKLQVSNQSDLVATQDRLVQETDSNSTERNGKEGKNHDSNASVLGEQPKLSRRAKARAARNQNISSEQGSLHVTEQEEVNGTGQEIVQVAVPLQNPHDFDSVESNLQLNEEGNADSSKVSGDELPNKLNDNVVVTAKVSDVPAIEGKGALVSDKQNGTAGQNKVQSLSASEKSVMKSASKGFVYLFTEKTEEIISPLSFVATNYTKMALALFQLIVPIFLTYLMVTKIGFVANGIANSTEIMQYILYFIFYIGCLCFSIVAQVIFSGIKGMLVKAVEEAAVVGDSKKE